MKKLFASQSILLKENRLCFLESAPASESAAESPEKKLDAMVKTVQADFDQMKKDFEANKQDIDKIIDKEADIIKRNFPLIVESIIAKGKEFDKQMIELNDLIKGKKYKEAEAKIKDLREKLEVILQLGHGYSVMERNVERLSASQDLKNILEAGRAKSRESAGRIKATFSQIEETLKIAQSTPVAPEAPVPAILPEGPTPTGADAERKAKEEELQRKAEEKRKREAEELAEKAKKDKKPDKAEDKPTETKEVSLKDKLDLYELKNLLKSISIEASPEQIKKAFKYYQLDGRKRGYIDGKEKKKTKEIIDGVKQLLKDGKIKQEQLAYIGSVDGTKYLPEKVEAQSEEWHKEKADALETLIGFIGYNTVIFEPATTTPDQAKKNLILEYIRASDITARKKVVTDHADDFLQAQGIFNMALAVQRARDIKSRVLDDKNATLDTQKDIIRIELGTDEHTDADRKSGLLLLEQNNPVAPFLRDDDIPKYKKAPPAVKSDKDEAPSGGDNDAEPKPEPRERKQKKAPPERKSHVDKKRDKGGSTDKDKHKEKAPETPYYGEVGLSEDKKTIIVTNLDKTAWKYGINNKTKYTLKVQGFTSPKDNNPQYGENVIVIYDGEKRLGFIYHTPKDQISIYYDAGNSGESKINITFDDASKTCVISPVSASDAPQVQENWGKEEVVRVDPLGLAGFYDKGRWDGDKFKGIMIDAYGVVRERRWKNGVSTDVIIDREPTYSECMENIKERTKAAGLKITTWNGRTYNYKELWIQTRNFIAGLNKASADSRQYIKDNNISIILNQNWSIPVFTYSRQGLNQTSDGTYVIVVDYWDTPENIGKTIDKAVTKHKEKNKKQEDR